MRNDQDFELRKGSQIGSGTSRHVYEVKDDDQLVIKELKSVGNHGEDNSNKREFDIWNQIKESGIGNLFGTCKEISKTGRYLLMERLCDLDETDKIKIPDLPCWLKDRKPENLGKNPSGEIKVRDYGQVEVSSVRINAPKNPWPSKQETQKMRELAEKMRAIDL
ncbi:MAG: protein kinase family protein [Acidobacteriaceae bacterium]